MLISKTKSKLNKKLPSFKKLDQKIYRLKLLSKKQRKKVLLISNMIKMLNFKKKSKL
jgi:hypothetical protein